MNAARAQEIRDNLERVRERIAKAEMSAGRSPGSVTLIAVSKKMPADDIRAAIALGQRDFGENYAQELRDKRVELDGEDIRWHYIGPLQSNKVRYVAGHTALLHTIDSVELLEETNRRTLDGQTQDCLLQVNVGGEVQKRGIAPSRLGQLLDAFATADRLRCVGLMTIPPIGDDAERVRPIFAELRALLEREAKVSREHVALSALSMGMSQDLEVAIAEGATLVRIGTALFGERR
ncbi:MAG: YggS family pyridoxal phosphate-dependent enzyme [Deltaproteobacteria bacterium]|nr:YggS family pyridoxal phosphate-dependent enzyme [Deltaproteobacteria bacterium]